MLCQVLLKMSQNNLTLAPVCMLGLFYIVGSAHTRPSSSRTLSQMSHTYTKNTKSTFLMFIFVLFLVMIGFITEQLKPLSRR